MIFAHIDPDGVVANVIVADDHETAELVAPDGCTAVDITGQPAGIGHTYDADTDEFTAPVAEEPDPEPEPTP